MQPDKIDAITAWHELERFADGAGIDLDERASPVDPDPDQPEKIIDYRVTPEEAEQLGAYTKLLTALQRGHLTISDSGAAVVHLRTPIGDRSTITLDPSAPWPFTKAMRAMGSINVPVGKRGGGQAQLDTNGARLAFVSVLAGVKPDLAPTNKRDYSLLVALADLISGE